MWPAALAHATFNTVWGALVALTIPTSAVLMEYLSGESGLITLILLIIIVGILLRQLVTPAVVPGAARQQSHATAYSLQRMT